MRIRTMSVFDYLLRNTRVRVYCVLTLLIFFVGIGFYKISLQGKDKADENSISDEVGILLLNRPYLVRPKPKGTKVPDSVLEFVDFSSLFQKQDEVLTESNGNDIVIYEIVDKLDNARKIDFFLTEAKALLKRDKLTSPKGNSAVDKFHAVLALDPNNQDALVGMKTVVDRYLFLADEAIKKKQIHNVTGYIKKAFLVGDDYIDMSFLVNKYKSYLENQSVFIHSDIDLDNDLDSNDELVDVHSIDTLVTESRTIYEIDFDFAKAAAKLMANDDFDGAEKISIRFTEISNYWGQSYDQLLAIYLNKLDFKKAEELINSNPSLDTYQLAEKVARLFVANNDFIGALTFLEAYSPDIQRYSELYAIKAGLHHNLGQFKRAATIYRKLISIDFENFRYWLGLAVCLDAISDKKTLGAFMFADQYSNGNAKIESYMKQRILTLAEE